MLTISTAVMRGMINPLLSLAPGSICRVARGSLVFIPTIPFFTCACAATADSINAVNNTLFIN